VIVVPGYLFMNALAQASAMGNTVVEPEMLILSVRQALSSGKLCEFDSCIGAMPNAPTDSPMINIKALSIPVFTITFIFLTNLLLS